MHPLVVSATTTRVRVMDGHTASISVALDAIRRSTRCAKRCAGSPASRRRPAADGAGRADRRHRGADRPQPRLDVGNGGGMTISIGRLRPCALLGTKLIALGHNTVRGAAGAAVLNAELMVADGGDCMATAQPSLPRVMKFGGTSVADAAAITRLIDIVRQSAPRRTAAGGRRVRDFEATDQLLALARDGLLRADRPESGVDRVARAASRDRARADRAAPAPRRSRRRSAASSKTCARC